MRKLVWDSSFRRALKARTRDRGLQERILDTLDELVADPFQPKLKTHKLKGRLDGLCGPARWNTIVESFSCLRRTLKAAKTPLYWLISAHTMKSTEDLGATS
jgi:hypothetical protein